VTKIPCADLPPSSHAEQTAARHCEYRPCSGRAAVV